MATQLTVHPGSAETPQSHTLTNAFSDFLRDTVSAVSHCWQALLDRPDRELCNKVEELVATPGRTWHHLISPSVEIRTGVFENSYNFITREGKSRYLIGRVFTHTSDSYSSITYQAAELRLDSDTIIGQPVRSSGLEGLYDAIAEGRHL